MRQELCGGEPQPLVAARVVEAAVVEDLAHVVRILTIDVQIDPEVEVVEVGLGRAIGVKHPAVGLHPPASVRIGPCCLS